MRILFLLDNAFTNDRRVHREAKTLVSAGYHVDLIAIKKTETLNYEEIDGIKIHRILSMDVHDIKNSSCFNNYAKQIVKNFEFEIVHAHDQTMLNLGVEIKKLKTNVKLIYDSHELFHAWPLNTTARGFLLLKTLFVRKYLIYRERKNIKHIDGLITVNESIRNDLLDFHKLNIKSVSIRNIPSYIPSIKQNFYLRDKFNIPQNSKILIYIGANIYPKTINIEQVIDDFANKNDVFMIFICKFNWGKIAIEKYCMEKNVKNVFFHDIVPPDEINYYLKGGDVGIVSSYNTRDLSYWYGLDNKLFEYMMAEIPILATKQPEYINIVEKYQIGLCINPQKENYFEAFKKIIINIEDYNSNLKKAKLDLNWENESKKLIDFYRYLY
jgi:alpha-maltose-1-phosphate synthase